jgi:molecular chaperone HscB
VDIPALEKQFRELSLRLHPDRFAQADVRERRLSLEQSTALNEAYKTLKDPSRRAFYLLKLHGVDLDREDAGAQRDMPVEFLEEVMELREELEGAIHAKDLTRAQAMAVDVTARQREALHEAADALRALQQEGDSGEQELVKKASHAMGRVRYFTRFLEQVEEFEEEAVV